MLAERPEEEKQPTCANNLITQGGGGVATWPPEVGTPFSRETAQSSVVESTGRGRVRNWVTNAVCHETQAQLRIIFEEYAREWIERIQDT